MTHHDSSSWYRTTWAAAFCSQASAASSLPGSPCMPSLPSDAGTSTERLAVVEVLAAVPQLAFPQFHAEAPEPASRVAEEDGQRTHCPREAMSQSGAG